MPLYLTGKDPSGPSEEWLPLYRQVNGEDIGAAMPVFDEFGPVQTGPPLPPASLVNLSSGDRSSKATEEEGEGRGGGQRETPAPTRPTGGRTLTPGRKATGKVRWWPRRGLGGDSIPAHDGAATGNGVGLGDVGPDFPESCLHWFSSC